MGKIKMICSKLAKSYRLFGKYAEALAKIPKVNEHLIWMNCRDTDGNWHRINGYEGQSLLEAINKAQVPIRASCEGGESAFSLLERPVEPYAEIPPCRECHIELEMGWFERIERHPFEEIALNSQDCFVRGPTSRLACCVRIESWMKEMQFRIGHVVESVQDQGTEKPWYRK